jgi:hypothetical protein
MPTIGDYIPLSPLAFLLLYTFIAWVYYRKAEHPFLGRQSWKVFLAPIGAGIVFLVLTIAYDGQPLFGEVFALFINIFFVWLFFESHIYNEWDHKRFFIWTIALIIITAFFYSLNFFTLQMASKAEPNNLSLNSYSSYLVQGAKLYGWLWTLFGIGLAIHTARLKKASALSYDQILKYIAQLLDRSVRDAQNDVCKGVVDWKGFWDDHCIQMALYTPSNGNVSCNDLSIYERYRQILLTAARDRALCLQITCLSSSSIKKFYGKYWNACGNDTAKKQYIEWACIEAVSLFEELNSLQGDGHFTLKSRKYLSQLLPQHLICGPKEAWLWVPHGSEGLFPLVLEEKDKECKSPTDLPQRNNGETDLDYQIRCGKKAMEQLKVLKKTIQKFDGMECIAFRSEDALVLKEMQGWIKKISKVCDT